MKTKLHIVIIVTLSLVWLILSVGGDVALAANEWFVRPAGGSYGSEDGSSYEDAWDGLLNVVWGPGGVEAGDTLYICGVHVYEMTDPYHNFVTQADIPLISGNSEEERIVIRGDYPDNQGIVWGAYKNNYSNWTDEGDGVWSTMIFGNSPGDWYFQDIGVPTDDSYVLLDPVSSIEELRAHPGGAHYSSDYQGGSTIYVKLTDGGDPKDRFYFAEFGYEFQMGKKEYITFLNLKFYVPRFNWGGYWNSVGISYVTWDNCTLWYGRGGLGILFFGNYCNHVEVRNCDIAWAVGGLGISENPAGNNLSLNHYIFSGNKIHDIGVRPSTQNSDAHGIGANGGWNGIIEKNEFYNCGSGITFYAYDPESIVNNTIRWNWFHDMHSLGGANDRGVEFSCGAHGADTSGNKIYGNIVGPGVDGIGYKTKYEDEVQFYNNVAYECGISFWLYNHVEPVRAEVKNCISLNPTQRHIYYGGNEPEGTYHINSDYNIFYPVLGNQFHFRDESGHHDINLTQWQSLSRTDCTFDPHSIVADPLFVDPENGNFHLRPNSPAIDAGVDVGLAQDFEGNPVPQGNAPDIGAYEYVLFPVSVIKNEPKEGHAPLTVSFDGSQSTSPNGDIVSYEWAFGDGSTSTGMKTSHIFTSAGEYIVTLTVTDDQGWKGKSQTHIIVFEKEFGELPAGCYNNVFNPAKGERALIVVELPKQGHVRLNLYNTRGNKIRELADEEKETGTHKYYWDGKSGNGDVVGSGLYFVHIQAGDYKKTKKIVVVK